MQNLYWRSPLAMCVKLFTVQGACIDFRETANKVYRLETIHCNWVYLRVWIGQSSVENPMRAWVVGRSWNSGVDWLSADGLVEFGV